VALVYRNFPAPSILFQQPRGNRLLDPRDVLPRHRRRGTISFHGVPPKCRALFRNYPRCRVPIRNSVSPRLSPSSRHPFRISPVRSAHWLVVSAHSGVSPAPLQPRAAAAAPGLEHSLAQAFSAPDCSPQSRCIPTKNSFPAVRQYLATPENCSRCDWMYNRLPTATRAFIRMHAPCSERSSIRCGQRLHRSRLVQPQRFHQDHHRRAWLFPRSAHTPLYRQSK